MASSVPSISPRLSLLGRRASAPTISRLMSMALENPHLLSLAAGFTDNATLPQVRVSNTVGALCGGEAEPLQYGSNAGRPLLRRLLAERLCRQEPTLQPTETLKQLFITNGSQQALYLAMQVLCDPGDIVLVDQPSYFVFLEMLLGLGVAARSIPVGPDGRIDLPGLRQLLQHLRREGALERVKAIYFVSYFSNPSGHSLDAEEKGAIARACRAEDVRVPVIEDAAYREMYFREPVGAGTVLGHPDWEGFPRLYTSTLTKPFASGLKVGYAVCSDPEWRAAMLHVKGHHDFGTANFNQAICERVLATGEFDDHLAVIRPAYERKMQTLHLALEEAGLAKLGWTWKPPSGGLYLWLEGPQDLDTGLNAAFCRRCVDRGVLYVPGELCFGEPGPINRVRLSFGSLSEDALREAAKRFVEVAREFARRAA